MLDVVKSINYFDLFFLHPRRGLSSLVWLTLKVVLYTAKSLSWGKSYCCCARR